MVPVLVRGHAAAEDVHRQLPVGADAELSAASTSAPAGRFDRQLDERRVAGLGERLGERHRAQVELVLVLELAALDDRRPGAGTGLSGVTALADSSAVAVIVFIDDPGGN